MQRLRRLVQAVDVLHHVYLALGGPGAARSPGGAESPERRPVAEAVGGIRLLDRRGHLHLAARRSLEVIPGALQPGGGPCPAVVDRLQHQVTVAVQVGVVGRAGGVLDLSCAEAGTDVVEPVRRRWCGPGRTREIVAEHRGEARWRRWHGVGVCRGDADHRRDRDDDQAAGQQHACAEDGEVPPWPLFPVIHLPNLPCRESRLYQPTATTMYCGLVTEMSEDCPASSSYGKPYCLPLMAFSCQNSA